MYMYSKQLKDNGDKKVILWGIKGEGDLGFFFGILFPQDLTSGI